MPVNIPRLVYFENFMNPAAVEILSGRDDLDLVRLEYAAPLEFGHQGPGDRLQVIGDRAGPQPEAGQAGLVPVLQQVGQLRGGPGEHRRVAGVDVARALVHPGLAV